ncbi:hypothetical protein NDN08_002545 [Rhodosorus marinus]|uniref:Pentatricopeptide repeat-containing protein-mitochondrial domain-containing protein n=1 Tax=Rhodosorus marinus TaxID=101924 RepID=A0AAV8UU08_9RHOD|nr:hypothetical protein NDN08_002545 [Rhodosorus marinus]
MDDLLQAMRIRAKAGDVRGVRGLMRMGCRGTARATPAMLFELMIAYRNRRKPLAAISVLQEINSTGSDPEPWLYAEGYKILEQAGLFERAMGMLKARLKSGKAAVDEFNALISISRKGDTRIRAWQLHEEMKKHKISGNRSTFAALLSCYAENGDVARASRTLDEMKSEGYEARLVEYSLVLKACIKAQEGDLALSHFRNMISEGISPDIIAFNSVIASLSKSGDVDQAYDLLQLLMKQEENLEYDSFAPVLVQLLEKSRFSDAAGLVERMRERKVYPDEAYFKCLISNYSKVNRVEDAERTLKEMIFRGYKPTVKTLTAMLNAYARATQFAKALSLLKEMQEMKPSIELDERCFTIVMTSAIKTRRPQDAVQLFDEMIVAGIPKGNSSTSILIRALGMMKEVDRAEKVFAAIARPDLYCYNELIFAYLICGKRKDALHVLEKLGRGQRVHLKPNSITYGMFIRNSALRGEAMEAREMFKEMTVVRKIKATPQAYTSLIEAYVKSGDLKGGLDMLEEMKSKGVQPSDKTFVRLREAALQSSKASL